MLLPAHRPSPGRRPWGAPRARVGLSALALVVGGLLGLGTVPAAQAQAPQAGAAAASSATPHPVAPTVRRTPIAGVDAAALAAAPAALDPHAVRAADAVAATEPSVGSDRAVPEVTTRVAAGTRPALFTTTITTGDFTAAGVSWDAAGAPADVVAQVRIRENGRWQDWEVLDQAAGPDPSSREGRDASARVSTEPVSTGDADAVQVRLDSAAGVAPRGVSLVTVDPGSSPADAQLGAPTASAAAAPALSSPVAQPAIYSRAQWGADESLLALNGPCPGNADTVKVAFVHHTVGTNDYTPAQSASIIRGIYAYHVQGNGWCDIGYNFLVDRFGRIFEGRHGGITAPVIGAHTLAFNYQTFGVAAMGTFSSVPAPAAMTDGMYAVIGWKLSLYGRDPLGTQVLTSAGGAGAKYPAGTNVTFNAVSGHRDGYSTECPGNVLYGQLPAIRTAASIYQQQRRTPATAVPAVLGQNASVSSPNGRFRLVMQGDGNLVIYTGSTAVWNTGTFWPQSSLHVQGDGNVVIYGTVDQLPVWSPLVNSPGAYLLLQDDGNLVLYSAIGSALWDRGGHVGRAYYGNPQRTLVDLGPGDSYAAYNGLYTLVMQTDGNLVEYSSRGVPVWNSGTRGTGQRLDVQPGGNLAVLDGSGAVVWSAGVTSTGNTPKLQNDGNIVIYSAAGRPQWNSYRFPNG